MPRGVAVYTGVPVCESCRQLVEADALFCPHCFAPLTSRSTPLLQQPRARIALSIVVVAVVGILWWLADYFYAHRATH